MDGEFVATLAWCVYKKIWMSHLLPRGNVVKEGVNKTIWDNLQHQIFLGDDAFVEKHQLRQELLEGDVSEIPFKQRSVTALRLKDCQIQSKTRNEAIIKVYQSGGYTMKEIGGYFKIHYSSVSRIVAASKKQDNAK